MNAGVRTSKFTWWHRSRLTPQFGTGRPSGVSGLSTIATSRRRREQAATYGSLGAGVGFMVSLWLSAVIVLIRGEINAEIEHEIARDTTEGGSSLLAQEGQ